MITANKAEPQVKAAHTPGPWKYGEVSREIYAESGREIATLHLPGTVDGEDVGLTWGDDREETEANARLIAAAPELLEALRMVRLPDVHATARAAIVAVLAKVTK